MLWATEFKGCRGIPVAESRRGAVAEGVDFLCLGASCNVNSSDCEGTVCAVCDVDVESVSFPGFSCAISGDACTELETLPAPSRRLLSGSVLSVEDCLPFS